MPVVVFDRSYVTTKLADNFGNGFPSLFPKRVRDALARSAALGAELRQ